MNDLRLKKLEAKYWSGETSLEEERELRRAAAEGPEFLSAEFSELVRSLDETDGTAVKLVDSFEDEFWAAVEKKEDTKIIRPWFTPLHFVRYAAAAVVLLCVSFGLWYALNEDQPGQLTAEVRTEDDFESPETAFEEAKKALSFASSKLNKAKQPVRKIEKFHQATLSVAGISSDNNLKNTRNEND